ncbi:MAG: hypothetical protein WAS21_01610 [Geminicoccaceae bacterium]
MRPELAARPATETRSDWATAPTLGQTVAGPSAYTKSVSLGIIELKPERVRERGGELTEGESLYVDLLGRAVPAVRTSDGLTARFESHVGADSLRFG